MIIKCSNCNSALLYDIKTGKMKCESCDSLFPVPDLKTSKSEEDMMEGEIFSCTSCGATVMVNNVECATHCSYCGQPTVIFERVSKVLKPHKILPFKVTKEEAEQALRQKMKKGFFIPKPIKHFQVEKITGIYVPFWVVDVDYHDKQLLVENAEDNPKTFFRDETVPFKNLTVDASLQFSNELSERLEPFHLQALPDFNEAYLSGFYADCYDENIDAVKDRIFHRCKDFYDRESVKAVDCTGVKIRSSFPKWEMTKENYTMLPVWFLTIRYKEKPYTFLVNGQTKKVVGAVPYVKGKIVGLYIVMSVCFLAFLPKLCSGFIEWFEGDITSIIIWFLLTAGGLLLGEAMKDFLEEHMKEATDTTDFSKNRDKR